MEFEVTGQATDFQSENEEITEDSDSETEATENELSQNNNAMAEDSAEETGEINDDESDCEVTIKQRSSGS